jgi:hypothetical protein
MAGVSGPKKHALMVHGCQTKNIYRGLIYMTATLINSRMISNVVQSKVIKFLLLFILVGQLVACGGGGGGDSGTSGAGIASSANIGGSVGDGPIVGATVSIYSARGYLLSSVMSDASASYQLNLQASWRDYPLLLKVTGGTDLVTGNTPDFQLLSVAVSSSVKSVNINPFSTLVVKIAQSMGGVNAANVSAAKTIVMDSFAFGLDPSIVSDPITAQITESNVANIVKASEVLGEMVRRTRNALLTAGTIVSGDAVMSAIAADLIDGALDGAGAKGVNPTISATVKVVSGQVLVEALSNSLKVEGLVATGMLDETLRITQSGISSSQLTAGVRITAGLLKQTKSALAAAMVLDSSTAVQKIVSGVGSIASNALPTEAAKVLPADASTGLNHAVTLVPYASTEEITTINQVVDVTGGGGTTSGNPVTWLPQTNWSVWSVDSEELTGEDGSASNAFDGDPATIWHTQWSGGSPTPPHELQISLGGLYAISGLRYLPRQDNQDNGRIHQYEIYVSTDGASWGKAVASGTFADTAAEQQVLFEPVLATHVRLVALDSYDGDPWTSVAELNLLGDTTGSGTTSGGTTGSGTTGSGTTSSGTTSSGTTSGGTTGDPAAPVQTGSFTLQWTAPVTRADGTPLSLSDIDGYHIHYGTSAGNYPNSVNVADGTAQSVIVNNLSVGTYYVVMSTYDVNGLESANSSMVTKAVK